MKNLDLVCKRYPNKRPSDYLKLSEYESLRFDIACAYLGELSDIDFIHSKLDEVLNGIVMLAKVQGAKKVKLSPRKKLVGDLDEKEPTTEEIMSQLMTPGTVIE